MEVICLTMHRTGSSVLANILQTLGVNMGNKMLGRMKSNPRGHFEDVEFLNLNERILKSLGGGWANPPSYDKIKAADKVWSQEIAQLVAKKAAPGKVWGWKDPRTCVTIPLFHRHLDRPSYILTHRDPDAIVASLIKRNGQNKKRWHKLIDQYEQARLTFLRLSNAPTFTVRYEELTSKDLAREVVTDISNFIGIGHDKIDQALACIDYRS